MEVFKPFYMACREGYPKIVKLFLEKKKEIVFSMVSWRSEDEETPLAQASAFGRMEVMYLLVNACKNEEERRHIINSRNKLKATPLIMAAMWNRVEAVRYLVKRPEIDVFAACEGGSSDGFTALHGAANNSNCTVELVKAIVDSLKGEKEKVKLIKMETDGETAKDIAEEQGLVDVALYLSSYL